MIFCIFYNPWNFKLKVVQTNSVALIHPSSSGLFVTCAYFDQTTLPVCVTRPS
jgi:hypothetical protein